MKRSKRLLLAPFILALFVVGSQSAIADISIKTLSNRADMISGGDALVEVVMPPGLSINPAFASSFVKASVDGVPIAPAVLALRPNVRVTGLVTGLKNGDNVLTVRTPLGSAKITITNYPIGGPIFSGGLQLQPWICATNPSVSVNVVAPNDPTLSGSVATRVSGLSTNPVDAQCNTATDYLYYYEPVSKVGTGCTLGITGSNPCFVAYDPTSRPADSTIADGQEDVATREGNHQPRDLSGPHILRPRAAVGPLGTTARLERQAYVEDGRVHVGQSLRVVAECVDFRRQCARGGIYDRELELDGALAEQ